MWTSRLFEIRDCDENPRRRHFHNFGSERHAIMYLDAIQFKVRDSGHVMKKAVYLAIGVNMDGLQYGRTD